MQSRIHHPDPNITDLSAQPVLPLAHSNDPEVVLNLKDPIPKSTDLDLSSTAPPGLPQPPSMSSLKPLCPPGETHTLPISTQPTLPFALSRYFLIAFFILCLLAFLVYAPPALFPHIISFR
ncbi:hypothetical protein B9Z19DRAFT_200843 [Tuber borchii]|uniref:Uncharacterized protein n=1 Tax=Tuber borchii TaxID=42251 RepID=A0A2T6ZNN5_TUBBO|nr:hypothetical protein B9Z19DRAFT_200843 [Tuber borchii]